MGAQHRGRDIQTGEVIASGLAWNLIKYCNSANQSIKAWHDTETVFIFVLYTSPLFWGADDHSANCGSTHALCATEKLFFLPSQMFWEHTTKPEMKGFFFYSSFFSFTIIVMRLSWQHALVMCFSMLISSLWFQTGSLLQLFPFSACRKARMHLLCPSHHVNKIIILW